jgi:pyrroloquinoline quinone (PQQ) biosynthesis protein C
VSDAIVDRFEQASWLLAEILHRRDYWAARRHPFHERWFAGALSAAELQAYAAEYHHAVVVAADVCARAATLADGLLAEELLRLRTQREREVQEWCAFAIGAGWPASAAWSFAADPLPETTACADVWTGDHHRSLAEHLVTLYALETAAAEVARPALDALLGRYGFDTDDATRYFSRRCLGDAGPAGLIQAALTGLLPVADPFALIRHAELAYRAYWDLLNGVDQYSRQAGLAVTSPGGDRPEGRGSGP